MHGTQLADRIAERGRHRISSPRARWVLAVVLAACVLALVLVVRPLVGGVSATQNPPAAAGGSGPPVAAPSSSVALQAPVPVSTAPAAPGLPVQVSVPSLGITSSLQALGMLPDHSLAPPSAYARAGWYADGVRPGAVGPAVIAGHVDSYAGPAVFFRLKEIALGAGIEVRDSFGTVRHFTVTSIQRYPKSAFPTSAVYGPTPLPVLRLITCTGDFDASKRSYVDNLVVSASLDAPRAG